MARKGSHKLGKTKDATFSWATTINPDLEEWRRLAEDYLKSIKRDKDMALESISKFLHEYIHVCNECKVPAEFLQRNYSAKSFYHCCLLGKVNGFDKVKKHLKFTYEFLNWILENHFSTEDDYGNNVIPSEFRNPFSLEIPDDAVVKVKSDESNKLTLPYRYIMDLRRTLCPMNAESFQDWKWAQVATDTLKGGDWFVVDQTLIDNNDTDCVWRQREASKYEQQRKGLPETVFEIWSPVRVVALYLKLLLPLRTYQVRMLDSGEADTYRYEQAERDKTGKWVLNTGKLKQGSVKHPFRRGVFKKIIDPSTKVESTGFFINTNKTADIGKDEWSKGYEIPWQYEEAQYWLAKIRDWQEKYNPINKPTPFMDLDIKHLGRVKDKSILKQMGSVCFLFRDAAGDTLDKAKPITDDVLFPIWYKLLLKLQQQCEANGNNLKLVNMDSNVVTYYPLHSLRVSLITAYALEGGLPMPILSKCIAGHARLVMTLYYTKAGITYVTEKMKEAEKRIIEQDQVSFNRFIKDATYRQLEVNTAINDPAALQAVINAQQSGASFIKDDKGICSKGALGCNSGGVYLNEETGKTSYGIVPGYPEQNCVRCRWFLTGPAFLPGLVHHFNVLMYNLGENADRLEHFKIAVEELENKKYELESLNRPFFEGEELSKMSKLYEEAVLKADKLANDINATLRLITRCKTIIKEAPTNSEIQLVAVGTTEDVDIQLKDFQNKLYQIQTVCNGATIFPETDASKAVLQRSQALDIAFEMNGQKPIFFKLTQEEQLVAGNAYMQLLIARTNSLEDAIPFVQGVKKLAEIGFEDASLQVQNFNESVSSYKLIAATKESEVIYD